MPTRKKRPNDKGGQKGPSSKRPKPNSFRDRFDPEYRKLLLKTLSVNSLKASHIATKSKKKVIRIHFYGIAATTLFDSAGQFDPANVATSEAFRHMCSQVEKLNAEGFKVQVRLLLVYPYSEYALSRIQAEKTRRRSARDKSQYIRDFDLIEDIDVPLFHSSTVYQNQYRCLERIERLLTDYPALTNDPNEFRVRFTTVGTNLCLLIVNQRAFWDTYMYAKDHLEEDSLTSASPLIWIDEQSDLDHFERLEDHFRYKWTLDTTLYCQDATHYDPVHHRGLSRIKRPHEVGFNFKAHRIKEGMKEAGKVLPSDVEVVKWKFTLRNKFRNETRDLIEYPKMESVFISCCWQDAPKASGRSRRPSDAAEKVRNWLDSDFTFKDERSSNCLTAHLFEASVGQLLQESMYKAMQESTLAIFIVTVDQKISKDVYTTSPNVWVELGYFQRHLKNPKQLCILHDDRVKMPSNLGNITTESFDADNFMSKYYLVLDWLKTSDAAIPQEYLEKAHISHDKRMGKG